MTDLRWIFLLLITYFITAIIFLFLNQLTYSYHGNVYLPGAWLKLSPIILVLFFLSLYITNDSPRIAHFTQATTLYFFYLTALSLMITAIQYTSFPPIDSFLLKWDVWLGFNTSALMQWTSLHPHVKYLFNFSYNALSLEMLALPLIMSFFKNQLVMRELLLTLLIASIIATLIYYFFPTTAPASVLNNPYFSNYQYDTYIKFYQIHHYLKLSTTEGGMIAFPSMHVIWAILFIYALRSKSYLFIPVLILNSIMISATLFLGWHYLADVIASVVIAFLVIMLVNLVYFRIKIHLDGDKNILVF